MQRAAAAPIPMQAPRPAAPVAMPAAAATAPAYAPAPVAQPAPVADPVRSPMSGDAAKLKLEIGRLEGLVKKLQSELQAEREYAKALEAHVKTLQESE
jgi:hypothetical protein